MRLLLPLAALVLAPLAAPAQSFAIAVRHDPPYAIHDPSGVTTGLAVDIVRLAAEAEGFDVTFAQVEEIDLVLGRHDAILPLAATPALERQTDLSVPIHTATLGVARPNAGFWSVVRGVLSWDLLRVVVGVSGLLLLVGAVVWALERRKNSDMFHEDVRRGLGDGFWWAGVPLTTIGYGDKAPVTLPGRAVAMLWMLMGLAVSASLTATIVAATGGGGSPDLPEDLRGDRVVVVEGGPAARFAEGRGLDMRVAPNMEVALRAIADGTADVALGASPEINWANRAGGYGLTVTTTQWEPVLKVVAMSDDDPRLEVLDRALLTVLASEAGQEVVRRYLDE